MKRRAKEYTLQEAISRVYIVKGYHSHGYISIPKVLIGKRVKLQIIKDKEQKKCDCNTKYLSGGI